MKKSNQEKYRALCKQEDSIPIFSQSWWLDAVCGAEGWDAAMVESNGFPVAAMPFFIKQKYGLRLQIMPMLTPHLSVWISYFEGQKPVTQTGHLLTVVDELIQQIPKFDYFNLRFHPSFTNWLPFYWKGFSQTTRYTYILKDLSNLDRVFNAMESGARGIIRKGVGSVKIVEKDDIEELYRLSKMSFNRQGLDPMLTFDFVRRVDTACKEHQAQKMFFAIDENGRTHAAMYVVFDKNSTYLIMSGADTSLRNSGAMNLLVWEAIKYSATVSKYCDFEGSMIPSIHHFFRPFGGELVPYFKIEKVNSLALKTYFFLKGNQNL